MPNVQPPTQWNEADFLTPEQRLNAVAKILAAIALRAMKTRFNTESHEDQDA